MIGVKPSYPKSSLQWPSQNFPSPKAWNLWKKQSEDYFTFNLKTQLKKWILSLTQ